MKKSLFTAVLGIVMVFLFACGKENNDGAVVAEEIGQTEQEEQAEQTEAPANGEENVTDKYREIYGQIVSGEESDASLFSLIYLDSDEIPELVVCDRGYDTYSVYTVKDGRAFCMMDSMATVEMVYFERKGIVSQFARWNGGGDEGGYGWYYYQVNGDQTLADGDEPVLHFSYDAVYDEEGSWTGEGITKYYHMGQEVEEETYGNLLSNLEIVEGNGKSCVENAFGKQEMLDWLGSMEPGQGIAQTQTQREMADIQDGQIVDQSFETELDGFGDVVFAAFEPVSYSSENPDYGTTMFGDVRFMLLSPSDGEKIYDFPGETEDNILVGFTKFNQVLSVAFKDYNEDGREDILLILEYLNANGEPFRKARVYTQVGEGREFQINRNLSDFLWDYTESMGRIYEGINIYGESYAAYYPEGLSEEELTRLLKERMEYYRKSAYYPEIVDYWENVREVRDVSNQIEPLYGSNVRYLTEEELASAPPLVIHLAKNEIYARHGYIFGDQDLYNYFMGCIWYTPTIAPGDFSDEVFNEYEKENLKLLEQLDVLQ